MSDAAVYHNITAAEHEERQARYRRAPAAKYTETTGFSETVVYTGRWADMLALAQQAAAGERGAVDVSAEVDRQGGDLAECRITTETFREPTPNEEEEEEPGQEEEIGSADNPTYTSSSSDVQVSLLVCPKFDTMTDLERRAFKAMQDGQDENSLLDDGSAAAGKQIKSCFTTTAGLKAFSYARKGVFNWNDSQTEATLRWKGGGQRYTIGTIRGSLPGGISTPSGRNWRCSGVGREKNGNDVWYTASFKLSGEGGWDPFLYSSAGVS